MAELKGSELVSTTGGGDSGPEDIFSKLGPLLDKLRGLDPHAFGSLAGLLKKVAPASTAPHDDLEDLKWPGSVHAAAFLQRDSPDPETSEKLEALAPVLDKLKGIDGKERCCWGRV